MKKIRKIEFSGSLRLGQSTPKNCERRWRRRNKKKDNGWGTKNGTRSFSPRWMRMWTSYSFIGKFQVHCIYYSIFSGKIWNDATDHFKPFLGWWEGGCRSQLWHLFFRSKDIIIIMHLLRVGIRLIILHQERLSTIKYIIVFWIVYTPALYVVIPTYKHIHLLLYTYIYISHRRNLHGSVWTWHNRSLVTRKFIVYLPRYSSTDASVIY